MEEDINAYNILLQRHLNDDRLMGERSSIFIANSSILFAGFAVLPPTASALRILLCFLGVVLIIFASMANNRTGKGLGFWEENEREIEENGENFNYLRENNMMPHCVYDRVKGSIRNRHIHAYIFPAVFTFLWIGSFIWVICSR
ncbi:hypothetical protein ACFLWN_03685 [Chloroflexota bacterium]